MSVGAGEMANVASMLKRPADEYGNDETMEMQWAMKAFMHAETHFKLVCAVDPKLLKLTRLDNEIYSEFKKDFPDFDVSLLNEDTLKAKASKDKWRPFLNKFEQRVEDWNMGSLLRIDAAGDISDKNTTLAPRIQFLAIEIARNREGFNSGLREKYGKQPEDQKS